MRGSPERLPRGIPIVGAEWRKTVRSKERRLAWIILVALSIVIAAAFTSVLAMAQDDEGSAPPAGTGTATPPAGEAPAGQALFNDHCARCHGEDGQGQTTVGQRLGVPAFTAQLMTDLGSDGIHHALAEGHTRPPAADLSTEQVDAIVAYVMTLGQ
jgi:mono/diheme cytochrome c family protein